MTRTGHQHRVQNARGRGHSGSNRLDDAHRAKHANFDRAHRIGDVDLIRHDLGRDGVHGGDGLIALGGHRRDGNARSAPKRVHRRTVAQYPRPTA